jgi:hypothetical protein
MARGSTTKSFQQKRPHRTALCPRATFVHCYACRASVLLMPTAKVLPATRNITTLARPQHQSSSSDLLIKHCFVDETRTPPIKDFYTDSIELTGTRARLTSRRPKLLSEQARRTCLATIPTPWTVALAIPTNKAIRNTTTDVFHSEVA